MKIKQKLWLHSVKRMDPVTCQDVWTFEVSVWKSGINQNLGEIEIEFEAPDDYNHILGRIEKLEEEKREALAEYTARRVTADEEIKKLLALEDASSRISLVR